MSTKRKFLSRFNRVFLPVRQAGTTGFTLVELLVSMGVFSIILTVVIAVFISASRSQHLLTELMSINNNVGFALEQMAREIRTGYEFIESPNCASLQFWVPGEGITKEKVEYGLSNGVISRSGFGGGLGSLTSSNITVSNLCFLVLQDLSNDNKNADGTKSCNPWRVVISMKVEPKNPEVKDKIKPVYIQTTVSSRVLPKEVQGDPYQCRKVKTT